MIEGFCEVHPKRSYIGQASDHTKLKVCSPEFHQVPPLRWLDAQLSQGKAATSAKQRAPNQEAWFFWAEIGHGKWSYRCYRVQMVSGLA